MLKLLMILFFSQITYAQDFNFEGIIKLDNCSGALVKFENAPDSNNAIIMTNGHCTTKWGVFIEPNTVVINKNTNLYAQVYDYQGNLFQLRSRKLLYATMTETDIAFYEVVMSYEEIKKRFGVAPFELKKEAPYEGQDVEVISGYWNKGWRCRIDGFVDTLKEDRWYFRDSIRFIKDRNCQTTPGSSGSPLVLANTRSIIGINNTVNMNGRNCTKNNPCEMENGQITARKDVRYGQQTYKIYSCLDENYNFDFNKQECLLPR